MPEADTEGARYQADKPQTAPGFFLKGSHQLDWGMKNRLARVFNPQSGRTVMLVMGVTAVVTNMVRDARYFRLACRIIAELGAQYVKTYYVDDGFETVTASCPVPIVMAGGKKLPEIEALTMAYNAVQQGASGVDMGRNIFQSDAPKAMIQAVHAVVHQNMKPQHALDMFHSLKSQG